MQEASKRIGDICEARVLTECLTRGYSASTPFGDNDQYDLVIENGSGVLLKAQVKGTIAKPVGFSYHFSSGFGSKSKKRYTNVDVFAFCTPEDIYIIPATEIKVVTVNISTQAGTKYSQYKNNWELLNQFQ